MGPKCRWQGWVGQLLHTCKSTKNMANCSNRIGGNAMGVRSRSESGSSRIDLLLPLRVRERTPNAKVQIVETK